MRVSRLYRDLAWTGVLGGAGTVASLLMGAKVPVLLWFGLAAVIVAGYRLLGRIAVSSGSEQLIREDSESPTFEMPDRPFGAMRAWEEKLELVRGDADYFRRTVLPMLTELVEERLRLAYGIDRRREPERVRALLGSRLADFLYAETNQSGRQLPSRSELAELVTEMEKLWTNHC